MEISTDQVRITEINVEEQGNATDTSESPRLRELTRTVNDGLRYQVMSNTGDRTRRLRERTELDENGLSLRERLKTGSDKIDPKVKMRLAMEDA